MSVKIAEKNEKIDKIVIFFNKEISQLSEESSHFGWNRGEWRVCGEIEKFENFRIKENDGKRTSLIRIKSTNLIKR